MAIPGNHDGEVDDPKAQTSLDGWVDYFMQGHPDVDPISKDAPRVQLDLPNVYWTLTTQFATIIGMYTNVPEHGSIDSTQQQWVTNEFATAPKDRALILALHHPIYSFDSFHSGSSKMADVLENAIRDTGRVPNLVLSGHVHDYQRIEQDIAPDGPTPFIVSGNGGYHNLHAVHSQPGDKAPDTGAVLQYASSKRWGFLTLTIDHETISGVGTEVDRNGNVQQGDKFSYSAKPSAGESEIGADAVAGLVEAPCGRGCLAPHRKAAGDAGGLGLATRGKRFGRQVAGLIDVTSNLSPVLL